jgi:hypothetical protein
VVVSSSRWLVLATIGLIGCIGDGDAGFSDLSASATLDLSAPRDAGPVDGFAVLCPQLGATCVTALFDQFASCFQPSGHCFHGGHNFGAAATWANCASYFDDHHLGPGNYPTSRYYAPGSQLCLEVDVDQTSGSHYCSGQACTVTFSDAGTPTIGGGATYDPNTGVFTCDDGTKVDLGPNLGGCPALNSLLDPYNTLCDYGLTQPPSSCP